MPFGIPIRLAHLPARVRWSHMVGLGLLADIGFTMSLFLTGLAFTDAAYMAPAKLGIFAASVLAGLAGYTLLRLTTRGDARVATDRAQES